MKELLQRTKKMLNTYIKDMVDQNPKRRMNTELYIIALCNAVQYLEKEINIMENNDEEHQG